MADRTVWDKTVWDELKPIIVRLRDNQPGMLEEYPDPRHDEDRQPPYAIRLAPWAITTAQDLHERFGHDVDITVGFFPYPPDRPLERPLPRHQSAQLLDPQKVEAALDGPAIIRSGHTLRHGLLIRNLTTEDLDIATRGHLFAVVIDPATSEVVGGLVGAEHLPLIPLTIFRVAPGATERIPLLIGTASSMPRLGYCVPPGAWGIQATLTLGSDPSSVRRWHTPMLPITITA